MFLMFVFVPFLSLFKPPFVFMPFSSISARMIQRDDVNGAGGISAGDVVGGEPEASGVTESAD